MGTIHRASSRTSSVRLENFGAIHYPYVCSSFVYFFFTFDVSQTDRRCKTHIEMADNLWKDAEHQLKELDLDLDEEGGYNQWDAAAHNQVHEEGHWEYWMRKNANEGKGDAVFNGLEYKAVSTMMPVPEKDESPYWGWFKKGTGISK